MQHKRCSKCGEPKVLDEFYTRLKGTNGTKDGYQTMCKECYKNYGIKKTCNKCGKTKSIEQFHYNNASPDGRHYTCIKCRGNKKDDRLICRRCTFLADCKRRVKQKDADWMPYCFVTSKHHDSWLKEYA